MCQRGGAYICPVYTCSDVLPVQVCGEMEICFLHIPLPETHSESGVTARNQPLLTATLEQLELHALLKCTSADSFSPK